MLSRIGDLAAARPKRTLLALLAFLLLAGVLGGPVAGLLSTSGGFTSKDSGSQRAVDRIEAATGSQAAPGVVLLVATPQGAGSPTAA
ncbi:MAG: MMPL family transporter, partial [Solirubrobacterales bacterium]|nr:MMPL family transporter [Solirubrobacterales bacterium]